MHYELAKDFLIPSPHKLWAIYANCTYALYGEHSQVSRIIFMSRVLCHSLMFANNTEAVSNLKSQMFYDSVKVQTRSVPSLTEPYLLKIVHAIVYQGARLAEDFNRLKGELAYGKRFLFLLLAVARNEFADTSSCTPTA
eukprot:g39766.t1